MMVLEAHEIARASSHYFSFIEFGPTTSGVDVYTTNISGFLPAGESFRGGTQTATAITAFENRINIEGSTITVEQTGVATFTAASNTVVINGASIIASFSLPINIRPDNRHIFPADRCTWTQTYVIDPLDANRGNYSIEGGIFYDGVSSTGVPLTAPRLGFIGKSGRFVEIAK